MDRTARSAVRNRCQCQPPFEECLDALGEEHTEDVYRAIERLVKAAEQVGFTIYDLIRMLNSGMSLEALLDLIELRMTGASIHSEFTPA